jgi:signal transduction histidine kinase
MRIWFSLRSPVDEHAADAVHRQRLQVFDLRHHHHHSRIHANAAEILFSVHSFGPVIPMADRERIFDRYYRSSTHSNRASGTGIGLSVAKRVALIHSGYVWVTSDEIEGPHSLRPYRTQCKRGFRDEASLQYAFL